MKRLCKTLLLTVLTVLTRLIRDGGAPVGVIAYKEDGPLDIPALVEQAKAFPGLEGMDLAKEVSVKAPYQWKEGTWDRAEGHREQSDTRYHVVAYDYGCKRNILRMLADRHCKLTVVPAQTPAAEVLAMKPDGVFLANGPGDPEPCDYAITAIREILDTGLPVFGICLGHQLLGLASGARTLKMKHGHHGANHPVKNLEDGTVMITSQNHGFAVDEGSLPATLKATHRSLFDGSLQAVERTDKPAFSFQGHPEASPGPHDVAPLFDRVFRAASLQVCTAAMAVALLLPGYAQGIWFFTFGLMMVSAGTGIADVLMNARISETESAARRSLMNLNHAIFSFAYAGAAVLTGFAREAGLGPVTIFSIICGAILLMCLWMRAPHKVTPQDTVLDMHPAPRGIVWIGGLVVLAALMAE